MPRLIIFPDSAAPVVVELQPGVNKIGRSADNACVIPDPSVSGHHCEIIVEGGSVLLRDLNSTNGTYLNGTPVRESILQQGQTLHVGGVKLRYEIGSRKTASPSAIPVPGASTRGDVSTVSIPVRVVARSPSIPSGTPPRAASQSIRGALALQEPNAGTSGAANTTPASVPSTVMVAEDEKDIMRGAPPGPPGMRPPEGAPRLCQTHKSAPARLYCPECQASFCELCVNTRAVGGLQHKFCRHCGTECSLLPIVPRGRQAKREAGFFARLPGAFVYPFRGSGVLVLVVGALIFGALNMFSGGTRFGLIPRGFGWSIVFTVLAVGYLFAFMQNIVHSTAVGEDELPPLPGMSDIWQDIVLPFLQLVGLSLLCFGPVIVTTCVAVFSEDEAVVSSAQLVILPALVLGGAYFPMAFLAVAMLDSLLAANPLQVVSSIFRVPLQYLVALILLAAILAVRGLGDELLVSLFPRGLETHSMAKLLGMLALRAAWGVGSLYLLTVNVRILGLLYLTCKEKLNWYGH